MTRSSCNGSAVAEWSAKAGREAYGRGMQAKQHTRILSGTVTWCAECGAYGESLARTMARGCPGRPGKWARGRVQQLRDLGVHLLFGESVTRFKIPPVPALVRTAHVLSFWSGMHALDQLHIISMCIHLATLNVNMEVILAVIEEGSKHGKSLNAQKITDYIGRQAYHRII